MEEKETIVPFDFDNEELFVVETLQYGGAKLAIGGGGSNSNCNCNSCNCSDGDSA